MPTYTFTDADGREVQEFLWVSELDDYLKSNPHLTLGIHAASQVDSWRMGMKKPDDGFREILKGIKRRYRNSTVDTF